MLDYRREALQEPGPGLAGPGGRSRQRSGPPLLARYLVSSSLLSNRWKGALMVSEDQFCCTDTLFKYKFSSFFFYEVHNEL
jgi:hypothetical protein